MVRLQEELLEEIRNMREEFREMKLLTKITRVYNPDSQTNKKRKKYSEKHKQNEILQY